MTGHVAEIAGHDPETAGHVRPKYAIVVTYEEEVEDSASGTTTRIPLGAESHQGIEEVMLPSNPVPNSPIFLTKKFAGNDEYRWQVLDVCHRRHSAGKQGDAFAPSHAGWAAPSLDSTPRDRRSASQGSLARRA